MSTFLIRDKDLQDVLDWCHDLNIKQGIDFQWFPNFPRQTTRVIVYNRLNAAAFKLRWSIALDTN